jgi:hypothetical protein
MSTLVIILSCSFEDVLKKSQVPDWDDARYIIKDGLVRTNPFVSVSKDMVAEVMHAFEHARGDMWTNEEGKPSVPLSEVFNTLTEEILKEAKVDFQNDLYFWENRIKVSPSETDVY